MQTTQISTNVIQLTRLRFVNAFLVRERDGWTLVDTMIGGSADGLIEAAERAGGGIRRIVLTHGHGDHVGSLDALRERLGDPVPVLMPDLDARIHSGEHVVEGKLPGGWPRLRSVPDLRLTDGDRVASLEVVATPGHSPGHVSFVDTRDGALLAGDVFTTYGGPAVSSHFHARFPFAAMATWDRRRNLESARRLCLLWPSLLLVGHGPAIRAPVRAMDRALARAESAVHGRRAGVAVG